MKTKKYPGYSLNVIEVYFLNQAGLGVKFCETFSH